MRSVLGLIWLLLLAGCQAAPVQVHSAPTPTPEQVLQLRAIQTRVVAVPSDSVFPLVINVLMDNGYVVRSANAQLGLVAFYQQWTDATQSDASLTQEGSILFTPAGPGSTQVRVMLTGGWQQEDVGRQVSAMVGGVQQSAEAAEYKKVLDTLEAGLTSKAR